MLISVKARLQKCAGRLKQKVMKSLMILSSCGVWHQPLRKLFPAQMSFALIVNTCEHAYTIQDLFNKHALSLPSGNCLHFNQLLRGQSKGNQKS